MKSFSSQINPYQPVSTCNSEGRESRSRLGLKTKSTETLCLVQNFGGCLLSVSSRMKISQTVSSRLLLFYTVSSWSKFVVFKYYKAKIQSFSSFEDGSRLGLVVIFKSLISRSRPKKLVLPISAFHKILVPI